MKAFVVITVPFFMVGGFVLVLVRDIGRAFRNAWLEAMMELESARQYWRGL